MCALSPNRSLTWLYNACWRFLAPRPFRMDRSAALAALCLIQSWPDGLQD